MKNSFPNCALFRSRNECIANATAKTLYEILPMRRKPEIANSALAQPCTRDTGRAKPSHFCIDLRRPARYALKPRMASPSFQTRGARSGSRRIAFASPSSFENQGCLRLIGSPAAAILLETFRIVRVEQTPSIFIARSNKCNFFNPILIYTASGLSDEVHIRTGCKPEKLDHSILNHSHQHGGGSSDVIRAETARRPNGGKHGIREKEPKQRLELSS